MSNFHEVCYPFIYEDGLLCDYEIATDLLCSQMGLAIELLPGESPLIAELRRLQELVYHLNGSLRGECAVALADVQWLRQNYNKALATRNTRAKTTEGKGQFVLPAGVASAACLHVARCHAKAVVRIMWRLQKQGIEVPRHLLEWANLLANHLFLMAEASNQLAGRSAIPFVSQSY